MTIASVVREVRVPVDPMVAFNRFTNEIQSWWPRGHYSVSLSRCREVRFGRTEGDAINEVDEDGTSHLWGRVRVWTPPTRLVISWHPGRPEGQAQEVEVTFTADGGETVVRVEHRGWEALGDEAPAVRDGYAQGWVGVLDLYRTSLAGA